MHTDVAKQKLLLTMAAGLAFTIAFSADHFPTPTKGIVLLQKRVGADDEFCEPLAFTSIEEYAAAIVVETPSDGKKTIPKEQVKAVIRFEDVRQIVSEQDVLSLNQATGRYADAMKRFPKARSVLGPVHATSSAMLQKAQSGLFFVGGKWMTKPELDLLGQTQPPAASGDLVIQETVLKGAKLTSSADGKFKVMHSGGVVSFSVDKLTPAEKKALLATNPAIKEIQFQAPGSPSAAPLSSTAGAESRNQVGSTATALPPASQLSFGSIPFGCTPEQLATILSNAGYAKMTEPLLDGIFKMAAYESVAPLFQAGLYGGDDYGGQYRLYGALARVYQVSHSVDGKPSVTAYFYQPQKNEAYRLFAMLKTTKLTRDDNPDVVFADLTKEVSELLKSYPENLRSTIFHWPVVDLKIPSKQEVGKAAVAYWRAGDQRVFLLVHEMSLRQFWPAEQEYGYVSLPEWEKFVALRKAFDKALDDDMAKKRSQEREKSGGASIRDF